jgi:hypothetical protein
MERARTFWTAYKNMKYKRTLENGRRPWTARVCMTLSRVSPHALLEPPLLS